jgi:hypothetical protein
MQSSVNECRGDSLLTLLKITESDIDLQSGLFVSLGFQRTLFSETGNGTDELRMIMLLEGKSRDSFA